MGKEQCLKQMVLGKLDCHTQNNGNEQLYYTIHKINSKWVKDWIHKTEIIQFQGENIGSELLDIGLGDDVLISQKQRQQKQKINKQGYIKLKSLSPANKIINKVKRQCTEWKKIFANHIYKG